MIKINKILNITIFLLLFLFTTNVESKILSIGNANAKVTVKVFSSLTCPHCAIFHKTIFEDLKKDFIDKGLVKFEHHAFPLNLPALNAEIIVRCHTDNEKKFKLLEEIYEKQNIWAVGSDMKRINEALKKIGSELNLGNEKMDECLKNDKAQDDVLNQKIQARKKYKIEATPTIIINEKEYTDKVDYNKFKKAIEKKL